MLPSQGTVDREDNLKNSAIGLAPRLTTDIGRIPTAVLG